MSIVGKKRFNFIVRKISVVLILMTILITVSSVTPPSSHAQSENDTAVFTGQFIPAFVGTAYDPSYAYQRLAGLPVYVFAYDRWGGNNFVLNSLAIRTQIRVDGSFQVQGLPVNATHYGVYFPFDRDFSTGANRRTDCIDGPVPPATSPSYPCINSVVGDESSFRMPTDETDGIRDVFSYTTGDATGIVVNDQFGNPIRLGKSFLTNETRVDIANNINTFPLVPTSAARITTKELFQYQGGGDFNPQRSDNAYEIVLQRVVEDAVSGVRAPGDNLIIGGRTTFPQNAFLSSNTNQNNRYFQVFAPPGVYAVTIWRAENNVTYQNYTTSNNQINSTQVGFGILKVSYTNHDWAEVRTHQGDIPVLKNKFIVWGVVQHSSGYIAIPGSIPNIPIPDIDIKLVHDQAQSTNFFIKQKQRNYFNCPQQGPWTYPLTGDAFEPCQEDLSGTGDDKIGTSHGVYAFYGEPNAINRERAHTGVFSTYINEPGTYDQSPSPQQSIFTANGPARIDLVTTEVPQSGIRIAVQLDPSVQSTYANTDAFVSILGAYATVVADESAGDVIIPAAQKSKIYPAKALNLSTNEGYITIPHADLVDINGNPINYPLRIMVYHPKIVEPPSASNAREFVIEYNYESSPQLYNYGPVVINQIAKDRDRKPPGYKLLGLIPLPFLMPSTVDSLAAPSPDYADVAVSFIGTPHWAGVRIDSFNGQNIETLDHAQVLLKPEEWSQVFQLPYHDPQECFNGTTSAEAAERCQKEYELANSYAITVVGPRDKTISANFKVSRDPNTNIATATPSTWIADMLTPCERMEADLDEEFNAQLQERLEDPGFLDVKALAHNTGVKIGSTFSRIQDVRIPVLMCNVSNKFGEMVGTGLETVREVLIIDPLTISSGVLSAWNAIRSIANVLFIFILLIIGINQILGIDRKTWSAQILLPQLIVGIVLANISLLIVQFVLDINNIITAWIFDIMFSVLESTGISANAIAGAAGLAGTSAAFSLIGTLIASGGAATLAAAAGSGGTLIIPIIGAILTLLAGLLMFVITLLAIFYGRYLIIWIMTILAPMVFAISVLPWTQGIRNTWWKSIMATALVQTVAALFLAIGILLISGKGGDSDGLIKQAGVFIIGFGAMGMAIKSPQYAATLIGGAGFAGQAFGALSSVGQRLGGTVAAPLQAAAGGMSIEGLTNRRFANMEREAVLETVRARPTYQQSAVGKIASRIPLGGRIYDRFEYANEQRQQAESSRYSKIQDTAFKAAQPPKLKKYEKLPEGNIARKAVEAGKRAAYGNRGYAQKRFVREDVIPESRILAQYKLKPAQYKAMRAGLETLWHDNNRKFNFGTADANGNAEVLTVPQLLKKHNVSPDQIQSLRELKTESKEFNNLVSTLASAYDKNVPERPDLGGQGIQQFMRDGYRYLAEQNRAEKIEFPSGGDKKA